MTQIDPSPSEKTSLADGLSRLIAIAAKSSAEDETPTALINELSRGLLADATVLVYATDKSVEARPRTTDGAFLVASPASRVAVDTSDSPASALFDTLVPIGNGTDDIGELVIARATTLTPEEMILATACADLVGLKIGRDNRRVVLENELIARAREVAQQRSFMERVVDSLPFGLYVVDRDYRIHAWNHKRETGLQGVARTDAIGRTIFEVLHRQPAAMLKAEFDDAFATGQLQQFQMESDAFGDTRTFRISKIPMCLEDGSVSHVITVGEDITDFRAALDRTAQSEKLAALGQLAAGVMHEINNPLATIAACGESIALHRELASALPAGAPVPGADPEEMLRIIDLEVHRCKKIINGLLDFARQKPAEHHTFDLHTVVKQGLFLLQHHPRFKRVAIIQEFDETIALPVTGDADQLVQVLIALAMNAIDASPEQGRITFTCQAMVNERGEDVAIFDVADEGPGVSKALQGKVFEPFFTTKPTGEGTGLGLAICYGIVKDHDGQLELIPSDGPGARFRVSLPIDRSPMDRSSLDRSAQGRN